MQSKRESLASEVKEKELIVKELEHKISKAIEDAHNAERTVKHMLKQFEWITVDQKFFGEPGSAYDFKATDPKDASKRVQKLEDNKVCTKVSGFGLKTWHLPVLCHFYLAMRHAFKFI